MKIRIELSSGLRDFGRDHVLLDDGFLDAPRRLLERRATTPPVRWCFAAAHVVMKPDYAASSHALDRPGAPEELDAAIDWPATMEIRKHLAGFGFGIGEAMDTAQRFFLGWPLAKKLIEACGSLRLATGFIAGAGADGLADDATEAALIDAVLEQAHAIQAAGGMPILLPLLPLARRREGEEAFVRVYGTIIDRLSGPLFIHWLGSMFHPDLDGYFPGSSFERILARAPQTVRGAKISLLDAGREKRLRRALVHRDQIVLTGDDWNFARLLLGGPDGTSNESAPIERWTTIGGHAVPLGDFSHALLGILDAVAIPASLALRALAAGETGVFLEVLERSEALGRAIFEAPTRHYKAGLAFLSWLNGRQSTRMLVNHEERARDMRHYLCIAGLASEAGVIENAAVAATRLTEFVRSGRRSCR